MLALELDRRTADFILSLIREEETKNDQLRLQYQNTVLAADPSEAASEQSFNREQVQEQEQVS